MNRQPALYRTPQKPGYPGGYDWRASCFGLLMLVVVNFVATQYVAAAFNISPPSDAPFCVVSQAASMSRLRGSCGDGTIPRRRTRAFESRSSRAK